MTDADNDEVRCRWATGYDECGGICGSMPHARMYRVSSRTLFCPPVGLAVGERGEFGQMMNSRVGVCFLILSQTNNYFPMNNNSVCRPTLLPDFFALSQSCTCMTVPHHHKFCKTVVYYHKIVSFHYFEIIDSALQVALL